MTRKSKSIDASALKGGNFITGTQPPALLPGVAVDTTFPVANEIKDKFKAWCTPSESDFKELIEFCTHVLEKLQLIINDDNSHKGLKNEKGKDLISLSIAIEGGLQIKSDNSPPDSLALHFGPAFKPGMKLALEHDKSLKSEDNKLELVLSANSGLTISQGVLNISYSSYFGFEASSQKLAIIISKDFVEGNNSLAIKVDKSNGIIVDEHGLKINTLEQFVWVNPVNGSLEVNIDKIG